MDQLKEVEMLWPLALFLGLSSINQQSRNLGDPVDLRSQLPAGTIRVTKSQARGRGLWHPRERKTRAQRAVPPREGNGACGMDAGSLSPFIVPVESRETDPEEACE